MEMNERYQFDGSKLPAAAAEIIGQIVFRWASIERLLAIGISAIRPANTGMAAGQPIQGSIDVIARNSIEAMCDRLPDLDIEIKEIGVAIHRLNASRDDLVVRLDQVKSKDEELVFYINSINAPALGQATDAEGPQLPYAALSPKATKSADDFLDVYSQMGRLIDNIVTMNARAMGIVKRPHAPNII